MAFDKKKWSEQYNKDYYQANKHQLKPEAVIRSRGWRKNNVDRHRAYSKRWKEENPRKSLAWYLSRNYKLTLEQFDQMIIDQLGCCTICSCQLSGEREPVIDHNHSTGAIRGLLCHSCNRGLGQFKDSILLMHNAIKYLTNGG